MGNLIKKITFPFGIFLHINIVTVAVASEKKRKRDLLAIQYSDIQLMVDITSHVYKVFEDEK